MTTPRPESRLSELESQMSIQGARIRELSDDTAESLRDLKQDIKQLDSDMKSSFLDIGKAFDLNANNIEAVKQSVSAIEARFDKIEVTQIEQGQRMDAMDGKLSQILTLLQEKLGG